MTAKKKKTKTNTRKEPFRDPHFAAFQCKAKCAVLRHKWEPECSKESSISFLLVEKAEKKLLAEH